MRLSHFVLLAGMTAFATYLMNASILSGHFFWATLYGVMVLRNLHFSYRVSRFFRLLKEETKRKG